MGSGQHGLVSRVANAARRQAQEIWAEIRRDNNWKNMLKNIVAVEMIVILILIPKVVHVLGKSSYLGALVTIFGSPGRRVGALAESLVVLVVFMLGGLAWATLGVYLGSLVYDSNPPADYAIRGVFLLFAVVVHGYLRSHTPRVYIGCVFLILANLSTLLSTSHTVTKATVTNILYPILTAVGINIVVCLTIFPQTSSAYLGQTTISTLSDVSKALRDAETYFTQLARPTSDGNPMEADPSQLFGPKRKDNSQGLQGFQGESSQESSAPGSETTTQPVNHDDGENQQRSGHINLNDLTPIKATLRSKLASCKSAQKECQFELAYGYLSPKEIKPISNTTMKKFVAHTIAVIGACERKYSLLATEETVMAATSEGSGMTEQGTIGPGEVTAAVTQPSSPNVRDNSIEVMKEDLQLIAPRREIEFGDVQLFSFLVEKVGPSLRTLRSAIDGGVNVITASVAYAYVGWRAISNSVKKTNALQGVPKLPSGGPAPTGITLEELDIHIAATEKALLAFDESSTYALENAETIHELREHKVDVMPREEIFLLSSFLLNLRQAANHMIDMLKTSRGLVEKRQSCQNRKTLHFPSIKWRKWLSTGGEDLEMPQARDAISLQRRATASSHDSVNEKTHLHRESSRQAKYPKGPVCMLDTEAGVPGRSNNSSSSSSHGRGRGEDNDSHGSSSTEKKLQSERSTSGMRERAADVLEWFQKSEDVLYTFKLTLAVFLVASPALVPAWNQWYSLNRGIWAAFQLVYVFEVALGSTVTTFALRAAGTIYGCLWGWMAWEARAGSRVLCAVLIFIGLLPCVYVQLVSKHFKAGQVAMVSIVVVALSTDLGAVPGSGTENFVKRLLAFMIGSTIALILQVVLYPVKARTRMIQSLAISLHHLGQMESSIAIGINSPTGIDERALLQTERYERASKSAHKALHAAEVFLPFCLTEPRIKGSFEGLYYVYNEMIFVLHQILDRMDNMLQVRKVYGSSVLEEFNAQIFAYRRNVAGSINLILFAVREALTNKLPLPQFLPSARLAQLRMINRVREVVQASSYADVDTQSAMTELTRRAVRRKFMSWNSNSAAQAEIVEYLEELVELTKLLVGANEFRSGMLTRPTYRDYLEEIRQDQAGLEVPPTLDPVSSSGNGREGVLRRRAQTRSSVGEKDLPDAFKRMQSRKTNERLGQRRTKEI